MDSPTTMVSVEIAQVTFAESPVTRQVGLGLLKGNLNFLPTTISVIPGSAGM